jgi:hypothetical protein
MKWLTNLFRKEWELTLSSGETFTLTKLKTLSDTHVVGLDENGLHFELKTQEPFGYKLRRVK